MRTGFPKGSGIGEIQRWQSCGETQLCAVNESRRSPGSTAHVNMSMWYERLKIYLSRMSYTIYVSKYTWEKIMPGAFNYLWISKWNILVFAQSKSDCKKLNNTDIYIKKHSTQTYWKNDISVKLYCYYILYIYIHILILNKCVWYLKKISKAIFWRLLNRMTQFEKHWSDQIFSWSSLNLGQLSIL